MQPFGIESELYMLPILQAYFGCRSLKKTLDEYCPLDFVNDDETLWIELKSRRVMSTAYKDAIIGRSKLGFANDLHGSRVIFVFRYLDKTLWIDYDRDKFNKYNSNDNLVYVPIRDMKVL